MDRANYELAWHLADRVGAPVHLVSYRVQEPLASHPNVRWHRVKKPLNSYLLAEPLQARKGAQVGADVVADGGHVIVNGGNCAFPDVNWVHSVHASWNNRHPEAPWSFRLRNTIAKRRFRRQERRALGMARQIIVNSKTAMRQIVEDVGIAPERVRVVYYGVDGQHFRPPTAAERESARKHLAVPPQRKVAAFIGALGWDRNKGFDILFDAWRQLAADPAWDVELIAAGPGSEVHFWTQRAMELGLADWVRMLGFTEKIPQLLSASDVLVSPTHYEAYGLGVHEALCCGLPAIVSACAGVAERYPAELADLLIPNPSDALALAGQLRRWRDNMDHYRSLVAPFGDMLRRRSWEQMSAEIVELIEGSSIAPPATPAAAGAPVDAG
jgi:glycosyltransferase involved in cell wall biosynthesis